MSLRDDLGLANQVAPFLGFADDKGLELLWRATGGQFETDGLISKRRDRLIGSKV